ncbi:hypothetical protein ROTMU0001_1021 [Rothia mucilaginosa ATCC 25296]|nr:hypothetical protein ROTMU0001_1021 [Rothia mucilaginosa ATCC 25296]
MRSHVLSVKPPPRICMVGCSMRDGGLLGVLHRGVLSAGVSSV